MDTVDAFRRAQEGFARALDATGPMHWGEPTPCADWDVRALVNHVTGEMLWVPPLMEGKTVADVGDRLDGDILGDDPAATWKGASADALAAFSAPGAMEATAHLSFGDFSGNDYCWQLIADLVVHSWDLASAVSADTTIPADLAQAVYDFFQPMLAAMGPSDYFAAPVDVPDDAPIATRLIALTGRRP